MIVYCSKNIFFVRKFSDIKNSLNYKILFESILHLHKNKYNNNNNYNFIHI